MTVTINGDGSIAGLTAGGLPDDSVQLADMAHGTDGQIITYDASGAPTAVGPGSDGQVLTSTGPGSPPAFEAIPGSGITNATSFRVTSNWNPADSWTDITANWEVNDTAAYSTLGSAVTESSGIFSFPSTGFWYISFGGMADYNGSAVDWVALELQTTHNNSTWTAHTLTMGSIGSDGSGSAYVNLKGDGLIDVDNVSNVKAKLRTETDADTTWHGSTNNNQTWITFIRLADT